MKNDLRDLFRKIYGYYPDVMAFAPGRVNLIGEHTDYNGGYVMPCAINMGVSCAAKKRTDNKIRVFSENFAEAAVTETTIDELFQNGYQSGRWFMYPLSVIKACESFGYSPNTGADFYFSGDLPDGAGLSSSAAIEIATGAVMRELYGFSFTDQVLSVIGQFAENRFIGVNCGIMDQFTSSMGKKDNAVLLDTHSLKYDYFPIPKNASIVIVNSGVKHSLASSAYNERRLQCEKALKDLRINKEIDAHCLCEITPKEYEIYGHTITDTTCRKRARHVIYENARTKNAADFLKNGSIKDFGKLMNESHNSLRYNYDVSCEELDYLVEAAWNISGIYGARMTGGGFGGCTINIMENGVTEVFKASISDQYYSRYGVRPEIYDVSVGDGVRIIME